MTMKGWENMNSKQLGSKIRELRKKRGMSLEKLGNYISVSPQAISQYELNKRDIPDLALMMLLLSLGLKPNQIENLICEVSDIAEEDKENFFAYMRQQKERVKNRDGYAQVTDFDDRSRLLRIEHGLSIEELANSIEIDSERLRQFEEGKELPLYSEYIKIFGAFGIEVSFTPLYDFERMLLGIPIAQSERLQKIADNKYLSDRMKTTVSEILEKHGFSLNKSGDEYTITNKLSGKVIRASVSDLADLFEGLRLHLKKSEENFIEFKLKDLEAKQI